MASRSDAQGRVALVTGAGGFTGGYVTQRLAQAGYRVHGWGHEDAGGAIPMTSVDLLDRAAVGAAIQSLRPDVVVHLAAISFVAHGDADAIYRVNVVGTRNLLEALAAREQRASRVILASSANIYGNAGGIIGEDAQFSPQNDYAVSKLAMEFMAGLWTQQLPITIVRPFNYTGVGQADKFLLPKIVSHFQRRAEVMELGNLDVSRDFYDVRGVADAYAGLLAADDAQGVYNICSGREYSLREVIGLMEEISGHRLEVRVNPAFVRQNEVRSLRGDNARLRAKIGEIPDYPLRATLEWMYQAGRSGEHA